MKLALLSYHSNAEKLYKKEWVDQYRNSINNQTYKDFDIIESNYGKDDFRIFKNSIYDRVPTDNFVETLNRLLDKCFFELDYTFVFNSNVDDIASLERIEKQLPYLESGYDIVSSNFALLKDEVVVMYHKFHSLDIFTELSNNHNIVAHANVAYSRRFWENNKYISSQQPLEDMMLWQRAIHNSRFIILEENLLLHRIHDQSVCQSENR